MSIVDERSSFPTECKLAFGSSDKKQHTNLLKWTEDLEVYGKSKFGVFATIFRTKAIPTEWISAYTPTPEEKSAAAEDEFLKKKIFIIMDERSKLTTEWRLLKPKLGSYLISALSEASVTSIQEKHRIAWTAAVQEDDIVAMMKIIVQCVTATGKTSNFADVQLAKKKYENLKIGETESIAAFNQRLFIAETDLERVGGEKKDDKERVYDLLVQLSDYPNMAVKLRVTELLAKASKPDFPTDRDAVIEELLTIESVSQIVASHKKESNKIQASVNSTAQLLTFADGSVGMQRGDGTYEVFLTDANGKLIGNKRMKGRKKKGVINLSAIDEKTSSGATKTATEKYIEKLVGKYSITAQEAKKRFQCRHCNGNGHLAADCRKKSDKSNKSEDNKSKKSESPAKDKEGDKKVSDNKTGSIYSTMTSLNLADADTDEESFHLGLYMSDELISSNWYNVDIVAAFMSAEEQYMLEGRLNFCLDSMANVSICNNRDLLTNVRNSEKPIYVRGLGGISKRLTNIGTHPLFGDMLLDEDNPHNILSLDRAQAMGFKEITSNDQKRKILNHPEKGFCLVLHKDDRDKFYKVHANAVAATLRSVYCTSLQRYYDDAYVYNAAHFYTIDQQQRAQEAIRLHQAFNHPSDKALSTLLVSPSAINIKITPADLANARAIYGPCRHCLEGKAYPHKGTHKSWDPGNEPKEPGELLHVDIVFINNRPRLFAVDHVTSYLSLIIMESKKHDEVCKALDMIIAFYKSNLKVVRIISCDSESVLKSDAVNLHLSEKHGIKISLRIPYEHEKTAERYMRMIREKMEAKLSELPYNLPPELYDELALDAIKNSNDMPNAHTTPRTPREMVTGEKFNFLTDLIAPFGAPVMVIGGDKTKYQNPSNSIGICLGDDPRTKGGVKTLFPHDTRPVVRRGLRGMDFTKEWITYMNDWAARKPVKAGGGLFMFKETLQYSEDGITGDKNEMTRSLDEAVQSMDTQHDGTTPAPVHDDTVPAVEMPVDHVPTIEPTPVIPPPTTNDNPATAPVSIDQPDIVIPAPSVKKVRAPKPKPAPPPSSEPIATRYSARQSSADYKHTSVSIRPKPDINFIDSCHAYLTQLDEQQAVECMVYAADSMTWHEAMKTHFVKEAEAAAFKEIKSLVDLNSWRYLKRLSDRRPSVHTKVTVPSLLLKPKYDAKGVFLLWKGRLVSGGHRTDPNVYDPFEKHSPTIPLEVAKLQLGIASKANAEVETFDIPTAYLNAFLHEDKLQVMRMPKYLADLIIKVDPKAKEYLQPDGSLLVEVLRALYGFPESAKLWNEHLTTSLINGGYKQCPVEPCLFRKSIGEGKWSIITVYVDDCMHIYKGGPDVRKGLYDTLRKAKLPQPTVQVLSTGQDVSYLGMNISRKGNEFTLSQPGYIRAILEKYTPTKKYVTPCTEDLFNRPSSELTSSLINVTQYLSLLMKLMFLATRTRPDLLTTVCGLATKCKAPTAADQKRLDRVIGYLANTADLSLKCNVTDLTLHAYFDAGWACHPDLKGHSGIIITLGHYGFPIFCKSQKHKVVTRSSTEAELVCLYSGIDILLYIRRIGSFLGINVDDPITVHQDNTSAITMAYLGKGSSGSNSKFMDLKYFWIKQQLDAKLIRLQYLSTDQMIADFFASPRVGATFKVFRDYIMGYKT